MARKGPPGAVRKNVPWWPQAVAALRSDPVLGELAQHYADHGLEATDDLFTCYVRTVCGQQVSNKAGDAICARLLTAMGEEQGSALARRIAAASPDELRACGVHGGKAKALLALSQGFLAGDLTAAALESLTDAEVTERITALPGLGPWSATMILLFGLARPDVFAGGDYGVRKGLQKVLSLPSTPSVADAHALGRQWHPWGSAATWLLWRSLATNPIKY